MASFSTDLRFALRSFAKSPVFTLIALLTLALGIGANAAIFSVVKNVLLEPLPHPEPERLMLVLETNLEAGFPQFTVSPPNFRDFRDGNETFEALAAATGASLALTSAEAAPERLIARRVSGDYFRVFATPPQVGRAIEPADDEPGAPKVVVLGHGFWQRRFGGDSAVVGRNLRLDGEQHEVIGVMPPWFEPRREVFVPLALEVDETQRGAHWLVLYGRLAPGVSREQAADDLERIAAGLAEAHPDTNQGWSTLVDPLTERMVEDIRPALLILTLAVGLVLLIACANVANLMLSRTALRERELALRTALGAGRGRLIRQMLTESALLAIAGGLLGIVLAWRGVPLLVALQADDIPRAETVGVDGGVLVFTLILALVSGVVFGLLPALRASRPDLQSALKDGGRGAAGDGGGSRLRRGLVVAEVAVALVLLAGAGLLIRSFANLTAVDPGFDPAGALTVELELPEAEYGDEETQVNFYRQLFERLEALPGVERAGAVFPMPLTGSGFILQFFIEGRPIPDFNQELSSPVRVASPGYFETMGIPLLAGRTLETTDIEEAVVVINRSAAERFWPGEDPLGQRITFGDVRDDEEDDWGTVIGVVGDVHHESLAAATEPEMYWSYLRSPADEATLVLRTAGDPGNLAGPVRELLRELDPNLPLFNIRPLDVLVADSLAQPRSNSLLLGIFAGLATLLAVIGVYGMVSYAVTQRLRELGVRLALGAERRTILGLVLRRGMTPVLIGIGLGLAAALGGTRVMGGLIHDLSATDPLTFTAVVTLLAMVAVVACLVPAWRATRIDPMVVLREE